MTKITVVDGMVFADYDDDRPFDVHSSEEFRGKDHSYVSQTMKDLHQLAREKCKDLVITIPAKDIMRRHKIDTDAYEDYEVPFHTVPYSSSLWAFSDYVVAEGRKITIMKGRNTDKAEKLKYVLGNIELTD